MTVQKTGYNPYPKVDLLTLTQRYAKPVETTQTPQVEEPTQASYGNPFTAKYNNGISGLVANATQNDNGSYNVHQYVDSGYGRKGITELSFVA